MSGLLIFVLPPLGVSQQLDVKINLFNKRARRSSFAADFLLPGKFTSEKITKKHTKSNGFAFLFTSGIDLQC